MDRRISILSLTVALMAGCGSNDSSPGSDAASTDGASTTDALVGSSRCTSEDNKKVYVVATNLMGEESRLYRFDPSDLSYTEIGILDCPQGRVISMAVDRDGTGWTTSYDGSLNRVNLQDASCTTTGLVTDQLGIRRFGMGYATVGEVSEGGLQPEKLFITATGSWFGPPEEPYRKLAVIDTQTLQLEMVGNLEAPTPANMELTGTGDGRLFGMVLDVRDLRNIIVSVDELNPDTGATILRKVVPLDAKSGFAFAHWGGDFWLFTEADDGKARVLQFDFDGGQVVQTVDTDLGFDGTIVGAGVSTCAPIRID